MLLVVNLGLLALLVSLWLTPRGDWIGVHWVAPKALPPALDGAAGLPPTGVDLNRYVATLERPLFVASRRPPPPAHTASAPAGPDPFPDVRLLAVYGNQTVGGVVLSVDARVKRLKLGESINGWTLKSVSPNTVELARADDVRTVEIKRGASLEPLVAGAGPATTDGGAANTRSTALDAAQRRDREERKAQTMRMNALRARLGAPPLPEP